MYWKHSILCSSDEYRSVNVYSIMIDWSVIIFPFNTTLNSSISVLYTYTNIFQTTFAGTHKYGYIYMSVPLLQASVWKERCHIWNRGTAPQGCKVTFMHIKNNHARAGYQEEPSSFSYPKGTFLPLTGCLLATRQTCDLNHHHFLLTI